MEVANQRTGRTSRIHPSYRHEDLGADVMEWAW